MKQNQYEEIECECGCGTLISKYNRWGKIRRFVFGHVYRKYPPPHKYGNEHYNWKGGKYRSSDGYIYILNRNHPFANKAGYIAEHRDVYEKENNCCLLQSTDIDHKNKIKDDNRIENLRAISHREHKAYHNKGNRYNKKDMINRSCLNCNSPTTYIHKDGRQHWYKYEDGFLCLNCYYSVKRKPSFALVEE